MRNLLFFFIINISFVFHSQACIKPFDNQIKDVTTTNSGDFVFISDDFKITKVDSNFDTIWHNNYLDTTNNLLFKIRLIGLYVSPFNFAPNILLFSSNTE